MHFPLSALLLEWDFHRRDPVLTGRARSRCTGLLPEDENSRAREKEAGLPLASSTGQPSQVSEANGQTISGGWG